MAKNFSLTWTPTGSYTSQTVLYRVKNTTTWSNTPSISPANPQSGTATSAATTGLPYNVVYQFEVTAISCADSTGISSIIEGVIFSQLTVTSTVSSGIISVSQATMPTVDTITYQLLNSGRTVLQTVTATGASPNAAFTSVSSGTYTVQYSYTTSINGSPVNSYDSGQSAAYYTTGDIIVS